MFARLDWLAQSIGLPYVPITPTFPLLGPLGLIPLPAKWTIRFGAPIDLSRYAPEQADDRILVGELTERIRGSIQSAVNELVEQRQSVLFG